MIKEIDTPNKLIGQKQTVKGLREGRVRKVFYAADADPRVLQLVLSLCAEGGIPTEKAGTMRALGSAAGIAIGAAVVALVRE